MEDIHSLPRQYDFPSCYHDDGTWVPAPSPTRTSALLQGQPLFLPLRPCPRPQSPIQSCFLPVIQETRKLCDKPHTHFHKLLKTTHPWLPQSSHDTFSTPWRETQVVQHQVSSLQHACSFLLPPTIPNSLILLPSTQVHTHLLGYTPFCSYTPTFLSPIHFFPSFTHKHTCFP